MNISLTPELEKFIQEKVTCGLYNSASEVVRESLRLMHTRDYMQTQRITEIRRAIDMGLEQLDKKQYVNGEKSRQNMKKKIDMICRHD